MPRTTKTTKSTKSTKTAASAKGTTNGRSTPSAADRLRAALRLNPGRTSRELAELAGIGVSTANKHLSAWSSVGQAVQLPGKGTPAHNDPVRWGLPVPIEVSPKATKRATTASRRKTDTGAASAPSGRLPKGALHGLVEDFLSEPDRRGTAYTAGDISRKLVRSSGAVRNALDKLVEKGTVVLIQKKPRCYQLATD
ncbi:hypothetical protein BAY61_18115 [Prauserella marina]|uniref:Uncharacterized protein n=1 Tax=Prauserella marina TaxID=530584 RepID=A0A222VRR0_9PSEU|nr:hypothetical protein [Prauserella marina]ASR36598.1 hypothetical protein BAY61_18115 [Prauserella marina]PWV74007.1 hypothetical protein DES30_108181 [Prauserella marina]SDD60775.1 hypothetical protein SAMN05421630_110182 [Prauserella marina]